MINEKFKTTQDNDVIKIKRTGFMLYFLLIFCSSIFI